MFANPLAEPVVASLRQAGARFYVYGLATDYCVKAAALGLAEGGCHTVLLTDAVAGISPQGVDDALAALAAAGVTSMTSEQARAQIAGA